VALVERRLYRQGCEGSPSRLSPRVAGPPPAPRSWANRVGCAFSSYCSAAVSSRRGSRRRRIRRDAGNESVAQRAKRVRGGTLPLLIYFDPLVTPARCQRSIRNMPLCRRGFQRKILIKTTVMYHSEMHSARGRSSWRHSPITFLPQRCRACPKDAIFTAWHITKPAQQPTPVAPTAAKRPRARPARQQTRGLTMTNGKWVSPARGATAQDCGRPASNSADVLLAALSAFAWLTGGYTVRRDQQPC
jgi:hypothetical protein